VMVTHDPTAASYADRVVFLADGKIVDEIADPTPELVLDAMRNLDKAPAAPDSETGSDAGGVAE
jgi:putative ABC transport system ATP-binding protein